MNINLDNYEQFLLMYVDNELSAGERLTVEEFLEDYPYLQQELQALQQTILPIENIQFDASHLLKPMLDEATQEKLLMHLDGELPAGQLPALQKSLEADRIVKKEWELLQKTKLHAADIIEHPDKESLYRKERARVITGRFVRWAVAAMFIGAGFYAGISLLKDKETINPGAVATNNGNAPKDSNLTNPQTNNTAVVNVAADKTAQPSSPDQPGNPPVFLEEVPAKDNMLAVKDEKRKKENSTSPKQKPDNQYSLPQNDVATTTVKPDNKNVPAQPKEMPQRNTDNVLKNNNDVAVVEKIKNNNSIDLPTNIKTPAKPIIDQDLSASRNAYAQTAALGFDENNQDQILMMEEENVSRSKAGIFLKKLKRNVERRANVKPGKSLRIAGFEFAVK